MFTSLQMTVLDHTLPHPTQQYPTKPIYFFLEGLTAILLD